MALTESQEKMVLDNLTLVDHILQKDMHVYPNNQNYEDYQQEGRLGLVLAVKRFDESRGYKFSTFLFPYIKGHMLRYHREFLSRYIHISRRVLELAPKTAKLYYEGYTPKEIMQKLNISEKIYLEIISTISITSIDAPISNHSIKDSETLYLSDVLGMEDKNIADFLGEERVINAIDIVANTYNNDTHKNIWYDYAYPAYYGEKVPEKVLAAKYHISQAHVSRLLNKGKKYLMKYLEG